MIMIITITLTITITITITTTITITIIIKIIIIIIIISYDEGVGGKEGQRCSEQHVESRVLWFPIISLGLLRL